MDFRQGMSNVEGSRDCRMTDFFALFDAPRRPWLDLEPLKQKFLTLSARTHPDKIHGAGEAKKAAAERFAELNAAYRCLADPKSRLRHFVELEQGCKPEDVQRVPSELADWFAEVARVCRDVDGFLAEKGRTASPLLQAQFFERAQNWIETLNALQKKLGAFHENLLNELKSLDASWSADGPPARASLLRRAEELYRLFGYLNRWHGQIQERIVRLTL